MWDVYWKTNNKIHQPIFVEERNSGGTEDQWDSLATDILTIWNDCFYSQIINDEKNKQTKKKNPDWPNINIQEMVPPHFGTIILGKNKFKQNSKWCD